MSAIAGKIGAANGKGVTMRARCDSSVAGSRN